MVCLPCIAAPVLLFLWYRFLQPLMLRFWNPWGTKTVKDQPEVKDPLADLKCPFLNENEGQPSVTPSAPEQEVAEPSDKKND